MKTIGYNKPTKFTPITLKCESLGDIYTLLYEVSGSTRSLIRNDIEESLMCSFLNVGLLNPANMQGVDSLESILALSDQLLTDLPFSTGIKLRTHEELTCVYNIVTQRLNYEKVRVQANEELLWMDEQVLWFISPDYTALVATWLKKIKAPFWIKSDDIDHKKDGRQGISDDDDVPF